MLEVKNITKLFTRVDKKTKHKSKVGIKNVSFNAKPGRIFGLIGANGAGKTTTMRIVANLTYPHDGEILLDDKKYPSIPNLKKKLGFVSGETQVYDRLTPYEIMRLFGEFSDIKPKELEARIEEISNKLGMNEFLNDTCINFSTGMKQKTSIARALVTNPEVIIFDEVTNGLDIFASRAVKDQILQLKSEGRIILYSTHIMPDAEELCDDIAIIHKGEILDQGEVKALKAKYKLNTIEEIFFNLVKDKLDQVNEK